MSDVAPGAEAPGDVVAVVLAAGLGKRLRPLTLTTPKALVPVGGRPLLEWHLEALSKAGVSRVILVVGYLGDQIRSRIRDGADFHVQVVYVQQHEQGGSGDALRVAAPLVSETRVLVLYADTFFGAGSPLFQSLTAGPNAKMAAAEVPNASVYGRLKTSVRGNHRYLVDIKEKDGQPTPGLINAGAYLLSREIFPILDRTARSPRGEIELTDAVVNFARQVEPVEVLTVPRWVDIGTPQQLEEAERIAAASGPSADQP